MTQDATLVTTKVINTGDTSEEFELKVCHISRPEAVF